MNKTELIALTADYADMPKTKVKRVVDALFDAITDSLEEGDKIQVADFGCFEVKERAARRVIMPDTKAEVYIPKRNMPVFRPYSHLKEVVNN